MAFTKKEIETIENIMRDVLKEHERKEAAKLKATVEELEMMAVVFRKKGEHSLIRYRHPSGYVEMVLSDGTEMIEVDSVWIHFVYQQYAGGEYEMKEIIRILEAFLGVGNVGKEAFLLQIGHEESLYRMYQRNEVPCYRYTCMKSDIEKQIKKYEKRK